VGYDVEVVTTTVRPTAVVCRATTWDEFPGLWKQLLDQVYAFLRTSDVRQAGHNVMVYLDDVPNVEVGVEVMRSFGSPGPVVSSSLPVGEAAVAVHRGTYSGLDAAHRAVLSWCASHGRMPAGPRWEVYGDWEEDETQLETAVFYLLS
jgi:effector-binding domain-containing protein